LRKALSDYSPVIMNRHGGRERMQVGRRTPEPSEFSGSVAC
jgi:hypothetical protein